MKRRTVIRAAILLVGLCVSAWQMPTLIEKVDQMRSSMMGPDLAGGIEFELPPEAAALAAAHAGRDSAGNEVILLSPDGEDLTPEERAALVERARLLAPKKPEPPKKRPRR